MMSIDLDYIVRSNDCNLLVHCLGHSIESTRCWNFLERQVLIIVIVVP